MKPPPNFHERRNELFQPIAEGIGRIAVLWNNIHEDLCGMFCEIIHHRTIYVPLAIWNVARSDSLCRKLFDGVAQAAFAKEPVKRDSFSWLISKLDNMASDRNSAIHSPLITVIDNFGIMSIQANTILQNSPAKRWAKKDVLAELKRNHEDLVKLADYAIGLRIQICAHGDKLPPWPERPVLPSEAQKATQPGTVQKPGHKQRQRPQTP